MPKDRCMDCPVVCPHALAACLWSDDMFPLRDGDPHFLTPWVTYAIIGLITFFKVPDLVNRHPYHGLQQPASLNRSWLRVRYGDASAGSGTIQADVRLSCFLIRDKQLPCFHCAPESPTGGRPGINHARTGSIHQDIPGRHLCCCSRRNCLVDIDLGFQVKPDEQDAC